jgi:hypothetical protein
MNFDKNSKDIICISYPTGGFGHFLYHSLLVFAKETIKPKNTTFSFSSTGDSHYMEKCTRTYSHDPEEYDSEISVDFQGKRIPILCDNGINNDQYIKLNNTFPNASIVRLVIDHSVRPIIYQTCTIKAQKSSMFKETIDQVNEHWTDANLPYAIRENFTLLYHNWPFAWDYAENQNIINVSLEKLMFDTVNTIEDLMHRLNLTLIDIDLLKRTIHEWQKSNQLYFNVYHNAIQVLDALNNNYNIELSHIIDLHEQGYINYCVESAYNVTIPVYDYKDWFANTNEIQEMIKNYV